MELTIHFGKPKNYEVLCIECDYVILNKASLVVCERDGNEKEIPFVVENEFGKHREPNMIQIWINEKNDHPLALVANQRLSDSLWGSDD